MKTLKSIKRLPHVAAACGTCMGRGAGRVRAPRHSRRHARRQRACPTGRRCRSRGGFRSSTSFTPAAPDSERIYALVGNDGAATRVAFAANATVRARAHRSSYPVTRPAARSIVQQQQPSARKTAAAAAATASLEGTLKLLHADNFEGGTSRFIWTLEQDDGQGSELDIPIAPTDMQPGMRVRGDRNAQRHDDRAGHDHRAHASARRRRAAGRGRAERHGARHPAQLPADAAGRGAVDAVHAGRAWTRSCSPAPSSIAAYWSRSSFGNQTMTRHRDAVADRELPDADDVRLLRHRDRGEPGGAARGLQRRELPEGSLPVHARAGLRLGRAR